MKLGALLICTYFSVGGAISEELTAGVSLKDLKPPITTVPVKTLTTPLVPTTEQHYLGVGLQRSFTVLSQPITHPVKTFNQLTFPMRHPLMAFKKFGEIVAPYQPALNGVSALSGPVTAAGVFAIKR